MFESFLKRHDGAAWARTREALLPSTHEVDRDATRIWFHFFPLALADALARADNPELLSNRLYLEGNYRLAEQSDTSHWFLYGHRYWSRVKAAIITRAESQAPVPSLDLATIVRDMARDAAGGAVANGAASAAVKEAAAAGAVKDVSLLVGITAVGLMTLQQIGLSAFRQDSGVAQVPRTLSTKSPAQIVASRKKDDSQGLFGALRGIRTEYTVTFDERRDAQGRFALINKQHLTTAAATDKRDYSGGTRLCQDGPIPVRCKSAACGSCWVGVLGGAAKLSAVEALEATRMKEFGYIQSTDARPLVRLACMARGSGNITIVIPPWNGMLGKASLGGL